MSRALTLMVVTVVAAAAAAAPDQSTPDGVVQAIFDAAKAKDASGLKGLCDPKGENDGDTKRICEVAADSKDWKEFLQYFSKGGIQGKARVDGDKAQVSILFGPDGLKPETFNVVRRDGKWYLSSF